MNEAAIGIGADATAIAGADLDARVRNGRVGWRHIESEYLDVVDDILATLAPEGPYAYTVAPMPTGDGSIPRQHFAGSYDELRASYENLHRFSAVQKMEGVAEIRGDWYLFVYGLGEGRLKSTGQTLLQPTVVLFPTMGQDGITGELFWTRSGRGAPFTGGREGPLAAEAAVLGRHEALVAALRAGDADAAAALFHPDAQVGLRDYLADDGTLAGMNGAAAFADHLRAFFAAYEVVDLSVVQRMAGDWFAFAELLWIVAPRDDPARLERFYTAAHGEVRPDGLFASLIGHGTPRVPV